jgi:hypothetical protein
VHTTAKVHIDKGDAGFKITRIELQTETRVAGIPEETSRLMPRGRRRQENIASRLSMTKGDRERRRLEKRDQKQLDRGSRRSRSVKVTFAYGYATGFRRKEPRCQTEAYLRGWEDGQADPLRCDGWYLARTDSVTTMPQKSHVPHNRGKPATEQASAWNRHLR